GRLVVSILTRRFPAQAIDRPIARGRDDPAGRTRGQPARRPPLHRHDEGVLHRVLGEADVAEHADEYGHRAAVLRAEHTLDFNSREHHWSPCYSPYERRQSRSTATAAPNQFRRAAHRFTRRRRG